MVLFNYSTKELTAKIVYYGPGLCGKTTNLQFIHDNLPGSVKGKMLSLATKTDRTLFFDFLPIDLGEIRGMKTRVQLYTVPGQVFYNETRKLVLKGADGIVFVADSQEQMVGANVESFKNLDDNLKAHGMTLAEMPHVIQFNKRDLPKLCGIEELNSAINKFNAPFYESVATTGIGVQDTLKAVTKLVLLHLTKKYDPKSTTASVAATVAVPAPVVAVPEVGSVSAGGGVDLPGVPLSGDPAPAPVAAASAEPKFAEDEIDDLVDEVEEQPFDPSATVTFDASALRDDPASLIDEIEQEAPAPVEAAATASPFEIDHQFDPGNTAKPEMPAKAIAEPVAEPVAAAPEFPAVEFVPPPVPEAPPAVAEFSRPEETVTPDEPVSLTEVAVDADLFNDPSIDVAQMAPGEEREIIVPVEVGDATSEARRFKLSIRLRLDSIE